VSTSDPHPPDDRTGPTGSAPDDRTGPTDPAPDDRRAAGDDPADAAALAAYATALADAVEAAIPRWVDRSVRRVLAAQGIAADDRVAAAIAGAAGAARDEGAPRVRALLATDVDRQGGTPLAILRTLVRHPTAVLRDAGARPVARDEFSVRNFPDDAYDLTPASFGDLDPALHEPGIVWGAAKAHVHLARRRREGMR
jgi:hypothetical protein